MKKLHPLYASVPEARRWAGALGDLLQELRPEAWRLSAAGSIAARVCDRDFAWVVLPRGAVVGLRFRPDQWMRREVRIARREEPEGERGLSLWKKEVAIFCQHFGITMLDGKTPATAGGWLLLDPNPNDVGKGGAAVRLLELRPGEVTPDRARCAGCWAEGSFVVVHWFAGGATDGQRCNGHAAMAGRSRTLELLKGGR